MYKKHTDPPNGAIPTRKDTGSDENLDSDLDLDGLPNEKTSDKFTMPHDMFCSIT